MKLDIDLIQDTLAAIEKTNNYCSLIACTRCPFANSTTCRQDIFERFRPMYKYVGNPFLMATMYYACTKGNTQSLNAERFKVMLKEERLLEYYVTKDDEECQ